MRIWIGVDSLTPVYAAFEGDIWKASPGVPKWADGALVVWDEVSQ